MESCASSKSVEEEEEVGECAGGVGEVTATARDTAAASACRASAASVAFSTAAERRRGLPHALTLPLPSLPLRSSPFPLRLSHPPQLVPALH